LLWSLGKYYCVKERIFILNLKNASVVIAGILLITLTITNAQELKEKEKEANRLQEQTKTQQELNEAQEKRLNKSIKDRKKLENKTKELKNQLEAKRQVRFASAKMVKTQQTTPVSVSGAMEFIFLKESGNRTDAINASSGACGLGQALPCSKMPCSLSDRVCQTKWFTNYAIQRYGGWAGAKAFWLANRWW